MDAELTSDRSSDLTPAPDPWESVRELFRNARDPELYRQMMYRTFDDEHRGAPTSGPEAIDLLLDKALLALSLSDGEGARRLVVQATRVPPGDGAPAPPVLHRVLRRYVDRIFDAVETDHPGAGEWFSVLRESIARPGDDITVIALGGLQAVVAAYDLPPWTVEVVEELVEEFRGPDPVSVVDRVVRGRSDERDVVLDVLELMKVLQDVIYENLKFLEDLQEEEEDLGGG